MLNKGHIIFAENSEEHLISYFEITKYQPIAHYYMILNIFQNVLLGIDGWMNGNAIDMIYYFIFINFLFLIIIHI